MGRRLAFLPVLALAACGGGQDPEQERLEGLARNIVGNEGSPGFRRADGSFDRADYRRVMPQGCAAGMRDGDPSLPAAEINRFCACVVDRMLATSSDAELFAMIRDSAAQQRTYDEAAGVCLPARAGAPAGPGLDPEAPPPEEPVPSLNAALPPPIAAPPPRR